MKTLKLARTLLGLSIAAGALAFVPATGFAGEGKDGACEHCKGKKCDRKGGDCKKKGCKECDHGKADAAKSGDKAGAEEAHHDAH